VSASAIKAPINPFRPRALRDVDGTIDDFARCAVLAREAGYDGVEIMGSEGYLLNQFLAPRTNKRTDAWGGSPEKRRRMPVEIVRRTRAAVGDYFIICYRMSMADYVDAESQGVEGRVGRRRPTGGARRVDDTDPHPRRVRCTCCSGRRARRAGGWARRRAGCTGRR
jgi:2,4-dienoyl-CoA reductase-like NADH-dependent reductase (Old Yellow Enzyme family)